MRIVSVLGWYFPDSLGGTEVYVAGLCRRLRAAGHDVRVAAPTSDGPPTHEYEHEGVPVFRYRVPEQPTRAECRGSVPVLGTERFHGWLREARPDVVHFHTFTTGIGPGEVRAAREAGARVFVTTHLPNLGYVCQRGTMLRWGERLCDGVRRPAKCAACSLQGRGMPKPLARVVGGLPGGASRLLGRLPGRAGTLLGMNALIRRNRRVQDEILRDVEKFVVLTRWAYDALIRNGAPPEKVVLNRLGHGHSSVPRKPPAQIAPTQRPIRIGFLGRLDPVKGADVLARAVAGLPREVAFTLELCGPSPAGTGSAVDAAIRSILDGDPRVVRR
ncbi:MAG TPA: glycosyltransferase, partial [Planctomycetaceae bacterium]